MPELAENKRKRAQIVSSTILGTGVHKTEKNWGSYTRGGGDNPRKGRAYQRDVDTATDIREGENLGSLGAMAGDYGGPHLEGTGSFTKQTTSQEHFLGFAVGSPETKTETTSFARYNVISGDIQHLSETFGEYIDPEAAISTVGGATFDVRYGSGGVESIANKEKIGPDGGNLRQALKVEMTARKAFTNSFFE